MKQLKKRFRVLHIGNTLIDEQIEFEAGVVTFPADDVTAVEFDTRYEAELYINQNELVYAPASEY